MLAQCAVHLGYICWRLDHPKGVGPRTRGAEIECVSFFFFFKTGLDNMDNHAWHIPSLIRISKLFFEQSC